MHIKCWGSRGSIPISGKDYIKYGGDTTCLEIRSKSNDIIIVDTGTGVRRLGKQLIKESLYNYNIIFTHAHWDHIMGLPFFKPLYNKHTDLRMYNCPFHVKFVETILAKIMIAPYFPVGDYDLRAKISYLEAPKTKFDIGSVTIIPIPISHPNRGSGYKFIEDGKSFVFLTDNELGFIHPGGLEYKEYLKFSYEADLLIHDAEYTPDEYKTTIEWGHSVYTDVLNLAYEAGVKKLGLFHINQERTDSEMDKIVEDCMKNLAERDHNFECIAVKSDMSFFL